MNINDHFVRFRDHLDTHERETNDDALARFLQTVDKSTNVLNEFQVNVNRLLKFSQFVVDLMKKETLPATIDE